MHAPGKDEKPTPIFGDIRLDKPSKPRSGRTGSAIERRTYNYSIERERRTTIRTVSNATIDDNTVTSSAVADSTVLGQEDATVLKNKVFENILKSYQLYHSQSL